MKVIDSKTIPYKYARFEAECMKCDAPIDTSDLSGDQQLALIFDGGYGWFTDSIRGRDEQETVVLCHDCAHALCDWLGVDPTNWHSHSPVRRARMIEQGHRGWDLPEVPS